MSSCHWTSNQKMWLLKCLEEYKMISTAKCVWGHLPINKSLLQQLLSDLGELDFYSRKVSYLWKKHRTVFYFHSCYAYCVMIDFGCLDLWFVFSLWFRTAMVWAIMTKGGKGTLFFFCCTHYPLTVIQDGSSTGHTDVLLRIIMLSWIYRNVWF